MGAPAHDPPVVEHKDLVGVHDGGDALRHDDHGRIGALALKLGAPPEGVFVVQLVVFCVAQAARVWMLRPLISFSVREYLRKAGLPIAAVTCASLVLPLAVYVPLEPSFLRFVAVCAVSAVSVCGAVYAIGLAGGERKFVVDRVKAVAAKFRKTR